MNIITVLYHHLVRSFIFTKCLKRWFNWILILLRLFFKILLELEDSTLSFFNFLLFWVKIVLVHLWKESHVFFDSSNQIFFGLVWNWNRLGLISIRWYRWRLNTIIIWRWWWCLFAWCCFICIRSSWERWAFQSFVISIILITLQWTSAKRWYLLAHFERRRVMGSGLMSVFF